MPDFRIILRENSEEYQNLKKIQKIIGVPDMKQIILGCINVAYEYYYKEIAPQEK